MRNDLVPLRSCKGITGEILQKLRLIVDEKSERTSRDRLAHALGNALEHSIAPEIRAVLPGKRILVRSWYAKRTAVLRGLRIMRDLNALSAAGYVILGYLNVDVGINIERVFIVRLAFNRYVKARFCRLVAAYRERNALRAVNAAFLLPDVGSAGINYGSVNGKLPQYLLR